jgi:protein-tyrosine phosphatase
MVIGIVLPEGAAPFRVLVVSDRSTSRGPAVQRLLGAHLRAGGGYADVALACAGVRAGAGEPMQADTARALAELDVDSGGHVARRLTERRVVQADLVLAVARRQARTVAELRPDAAARTFTVHEFARLAAAGAGAAGARRSATVAERVSALDALRSRPGEVSHGVEDDIADPAGGGYADHRRMVRGVDAVTLQLARVLTPLPAMVAAAETDAAAGAGAAAGNGARAARDTAARAAGDTTRAGDDTGDTTGDTTRAGDDTVDDTAEAV